ncbi:hypothetical protein A3K82_01805 [Candidatus Pacearchaeota archaeon RBG_19FT_COMBO_34_9]|nr:MAG: hypothetical protein A3K82_01805 [Candidatus Pacearchaeota archaeon RBG_19FT_COMBO_34_9]OGJ16716.1 MAG: hypothetical protein A3K74_00680 [Candidatus Pacearchaeota archaeon RBG_13_33_26]
MEDESPNLPKVISLTNDYYQNLLGYSVQDTKLKSIKGEQWNSFCQKSNLNHNSSGIYLPRNKTAIIPKNNKLSLFHEYFGHGLYCEKSLSGRKLVDLEKRLLEEEKLEFSNSRFTLDDIQRFRKRNQTFQELDEFRKQNLGIYEGFAIWTEFLLSGQFNLREIFERKYDSLNLENKAVIDEMINFNKQYGNLATFYEFGLARKTTPERVKKLLEDIYGKEAINNSKLVLLTGSKKSFSDIDLFASSNYLQSIKNSWLDLVVFDEKDFEKKVRLFEVQVIHPIINGEFVIGDKNYLEQKRKQLEEQPITEEAIQHNLKLSKEQEELGLKYSRNSKERQIGLSYGKTYLANALALKNGKRPLTKERLSNLQCKKFIELKGGMK